MKTTTNTTKTTESTNTLITDITTILSKLSEATTNVRTYSYSLAIEMSELYAITGDKRQVSRTVSKIIKDHNYTITADTLKHVKAVAYSLDKDTIQDCNKNGMSFESLYYARKLSNPVQYCAMTQKQIREIASSENSNGETSEKITMNDLKTFLESKGFTMEDVKAYKEAHKTTSEENEAPSESPKAKKTTKRSSTKTAKASSKAKTTTKTTAKKSSKTTKRSSTKTTKKAS